MNAFALPAGRPARLLLIAVPAALVLLCAIAMLWLNHEPARFDPFQRGAAHAEAHGHAQVIGYTTTSTLIEVIGVLLDKRGGYLSNDILPPWVFLDNVPNWEFGVLTQSRDLARTLRNDLSRSQTQSTEDTDLAEADPLLHYDNGRWIPPDTEGRYRKGAEALEPNLLALRIQPDEGISLRFGSKVPGQALNIRPVKMDFRYGAAFGGEPPEAYERLQLDCMLGDATLFTRADEVEAAWALIDPIIEGWQATPPADFPNYEAGGWGPAAANELIERDGRKWRRP